MSTTATICRTSAAEVQYLGRGKAAFAIRFPGQDFLASSWSIRHLKKSGAGQGNVNLFFTRISRETRLEAMPDRYSDMIKTYFAVCGKEPGTMYNGSTAARWLWEAITARLGGNDAVFSWTGFTQEDAEQAEALMLASGMSSSSAYRRCVDLQSILSGLAKAGVIAPVQPTIQSARQDSLDRMTLDGREARDVLLPSEEAIRGLADVFNDSYPLDPFDQLLSCVPALMFASGLRIIEPLQFTISPIRKERERTFLCYFKAKGKGIVEEKIPLTRGQAALASEAVGRALELTREARERARELVASPREFPLPEWALKKEWLSPQEVGSLLGLKKLGDLSEHVETKQPAESRAPLFSRQSLQLRLQRVRERLSLESIRGVTKRADGTWLPLDEALFICFQNQGHDTKGTSPLMVSLVSQQQIGTFLGGASNGLKSIFERVGIAEKDGRYVCLNSHQLRHYVTSKASAAGVSDAHLLRWQRRAHEGDIEAYKHLTTAERLRTLRGHVRSGRLKGDVATMYFALAPDERDVFIETVVQAIHVTHLGLCVHDFNASPCPSAMNCVKRCGSFLFDTEDKKQRERLFTLQLRNARALADAEAAQAAGKGLMVEEWVRDLKETDEGLRIILVAESVHGKGVVAPFKDSPSRFQEFE